MSNKLNLMAVGAALVVGLAGGYLLFGGSEPPPSGTGESQAVAERKPLFYRNAMNPTVTSPIPAKDSMGMDYIAVYADDEGDSDAPAGTVKIDAVTVQNIGVRTERATEGPLSRSVRAVGRVDFDETLLARIYPKIDGWVETLMVDKTGAQVKKGDVLLSIYSPQIVASQEEYLLALKNRKTLGNSSLEDIRRGAESLVKSARLRLQLLDLPQHQIKALEQSGEINRATHIHSPFNGVVIKLGVQAGQYVTPKTQLYQIADLTKVWVYAEVFEFELPWIKEGDSAQITVEGVPGREFHGHISYIYPYLDRKTRTAKVRLEFDNSDGALRPEMFANVVLKSARSEPAVLVPAQAIVRSGTRKQVFVVREPGKFEPREVVVGITSEGKTQILEGVEAGEEVVVSAQFLIDSESSLREATAKMMRGAPGAATDDAEMKMDMPLPDAPGAPMDMGEMNMNPESAQP
ncbi:MAG TPA: efflux RND transporter periplasmic adaptor subunit [Chromatiales bacterium]|nr:efflux RND transporter periplasmic adaptor subunit [Chromatiales bacterium]HEX22680.1 efflux RND transporter periplasmic adaptor subunit [Chromatiales bacterium]